MNPDLKPENLDKLRALGYRPGVVLVLIHNKKALIGYIKKYEMWMFPQGGVNNFETTQQAIEREAIEELGKENFEKCTKEYRFLYADKLRFAKHLEGDRELKTDDGTEIKMIGKGYFFFTVDCVDSQIDFKNTEFDDFKWLSYSQLVNLIEKNPAKNRKLIDLKAVEEMKKEAIID